MLNWGENFDDAKSMIHTKETDKSGLINIKTSVLQKGLLIE